MKINKQKIRAIFLCVFILLIYCGCTLFFPDQKGLSSEHISFRDIPGVTTEEIIAIEALREQYDSFRYASTWGTESFITKNG
jgi:hypothetical protein